MSRKFDFIVIGAGSGGVAAARRAASHGARVAIIEQGRVGGTCVLRGCVPKKLLMYASRHGTGLAEAADFGWQWPTAPEFSMSHWARAKATETARLERIYQQLLADSGVELVTGRARLEAAGEIMVGQQHLQGTHILLATGASADHSLIPGAEQAAGSDQVLDLQQLPERITILGGGYIGVEFASILAGLGCAVSMRYRGNLPLRGFDPDLRRRIAASLQQQGIVLHPGALPQQVTKQTDGWQLHVGNGSETTDYLLAALGRKPNTADLGLERVGLELAAGGAVPVDAQLQTAVRGLYAVGDITHRKDLTPVAVAEGRWLADRLFAASVRPPPSLQHVPTAVFSLTPAASVGLAEDECPPGTAVYESDFRPMRLAFGTRRERCYLKLLASPMDGKVLGIHMHGSDAPEIIQSLAIAVTAGLSKDDFDRTMALHPSTAEEFVLLGKPTRYLA